MEWRDEGIIIGTRKHGETSAIVEVMTPHHGRHLGMVRGGRSKRLQPLLQPGNKVSLIWRARLEDHMGAFLIEPLEHHAARLFASAIGVFGLQAIGAHLRFLPERDLHLALYETLQIMLPHLSEPRVIGELFIRFELLILEELGFGLDLQTCAATGVRGDLIYVSPKSGRAVSASAGRPYHDKMLNLPEFLTQPASVQRRADASALECGLQLTQYFFNRYVYEPRGIKPSHERAAFARALAKAFEKQ